MTSSRHLLRQQRVSRRAKQQFELEGRARSPKNSIEPDQHRDASLPTRAFQDDSVPERAFKDDSMPPRALQAFGAGKVTSGEFEPARIPRLGPSKVPGLSKMPGKVNSRSQMDWKDASVPGEAIEKVGWEKIRGVPNLVREHYLEDELKKRDRRIRRLERKVFN